MEQVSLSKITRILAGVLLFGVVGLSLYIVGSPLKNRELRIDQERLENAHIVSEAVEVFYAKRNRLPESLQELYNFSDLLPTFNGQRYSYLYRELADISESEFFDIEYKILEKHSYSLCSTFFHPSSERDAYRNRWENKKSSQWSHPAGHHCFTLSATS
jgi:hypothetical protein